MRSVPHYTTDLNGAVADSRYPVYFDATLSEQQVQGVRRAIAAGKHIYAEKPIATRSFCPLLNSPNARC